MSQPLISIIIPCYNSQETLERAVESALHQTYTNIEIILIDDGSKDQTPAMCDRYAAADSRIKAIHMGDLGVSAARNKGMELAAGELITFLDADDSLRPMMLEELYQLHLTKQADICSCSFTSSDEPPKEEEKIRVLTGSDIISEGILNLDTRVWSKLYTRKVIGSHTFTEGLTIGEDMLFFLSLVTENTVYAATDKKMYCYTVNPKGAMERPFTPSYMDQIRCWDLAEDMIRSHFPELLDKKELYAKLGQLQITSAILVAAKLVMLDGNQFAEYKEMFHYAREKAALYRKVSDAAAGLSSDYQRKLYLLEKMPGIYRMIYGNLKRLRRKI